MAQLDSSQRHIDDSKSQGTESSSDIKTPRSQTSPTFQQLIQGEASVWSPTSSPKLRKNNHHEEDHHNRKSVIMKVKERAKKLRHSLSGKKKHHDNLSSDNSTPSWGVRLEDYEVEEEDPEYLGAPMYESEMAPENYKETARQRPREVHGMPSEKHASNSTVRKEEEEEEQYHSPKQGNEEHSIPKKTITETVSDRLGPTYAAVSETVSKKLAPAYAAVSDATHNVANKIASLTISTPEGTGTGKDNAYISTTNSTRPVNTKRSLSAHAPISTTTASTTNTKSSTQNPSSTYVTEAIEEENHGRILQSN